MVKRGIYFSSKSLNKVHISSSCAPVVERGHGVLLLASVGKDSIWLVIEEAVRTDQAIWGKFSVTFQ
jgi:hypothetical protein